MKVLRLLHLQLGTTIALYVVDYVERFSKADFKNVVKILYTTYLLCFKNFQSWRFDSQSLDWIYIHM
jgi:hypothetical protein